MDHFEFTFDPLVLVAVFALIVVHELIPLAYGIVTSTPGVTVVGMLMTLCAVGDVLIVIKLLRFRTTASDVVIYDHPTCGEALCLRGSAVANNGWGMDARLFSCGLVSHVEAYAHLLPGVRCGIDFEDTAFQHVAMSEVQ